MKNHDSKMTQGITTIESKINNKIYIIRSQKVMLDYDLAELYEVETRRLNEAVRRNMTRFPLDFMFQLTKDENRNLKSQFATSSLTEYGGRRKLPFAFTEQGVAMLSTVLNSERAINVNIQIMRIFSKLRELLLSHKDLQNKIEKLEQKYDGQFKIVFEALRQLIQEEEKPKEKLGFRTSNLKTNL